MSEKFIHQHAKKIAEFLESSTNVERVEFKGAVTNIILDFQKNIKIKVQINNSEQQMNIIENDQLDIYFDPNFGNLFVND